MNKLKYCLSSRQSAEYLKQADEIRVDFRDRKVIPDLIEKYPQARINLLLPTILDTETEIDWKEIEIDNTLARGNMILGISNGAQLTEAVERGILFYHRVQLHTFQEVRDLYQAGVSEAILGAPLFFQLDKIKRHFPDLKVRAIANVALLEGSMSYNNGVTGTWIRPEDVPTYDPYVSILEFYGERSVEQALFRIYAEQHNWPSRLNLIVKDLDHEATNRMIPPSLAEVRLSCGQRCMENDICHLCQRTLDTANPEWIKKVLEATENT